MHAKSPINSLDIFARMKAFTHIYMQAYKADCVQVELENDEQQKENSKPGVICAVICKFLQAFSRFWFLFVGLGST